MRALLATLVFVIFSTLAAAQDVRTRGLESAGLGVQLYPAGAIINLKANWAMSANSMLVGKLGYNIAMRQDFGKHDDEEGGGPGFTLAYKRYFKSGFSGWFLEGRASMWFLDIDWRDDQPLRSGNTDITVLQPTIGLGYDFLINDSIKLGLIGAFGYELNVATSGEPVGEGGISLLGISFAYKLGSKRSAVSSRN
ncbi:hypothetical protein BFP97_09275 [Roseivirga sp. 4D4]|uniref:hypothetical protein n=1 Tax=Roseivirga sp. 4D4 TaxID=1889784 RepID=UPI00085290B4|nr:hypothetical protein [Roseivirga sp. 4D4]OEK01695.1 hypothetical protein BFP97_09275 [Roseivirga sp. 4D4]